MYRDLDKAPGLDEDSPAGKLEDETVEEITGETYGPLKALCEQAAEQALPGRALNIRPGLIVGPHDPTGRFTYWPVRIARGGDVLAPDGPDWHTQVIDARDLAEWTIRMIEAKATGVFNATGPDYPLTFGKVLDECKAVSGSDPKFVWVDEKWLLDADVQPWSELPLWLGGGDMTASVSKAIANGITFRPLADTIRDTLAWEATGPPDRAPRAGMKREREEELLREWNDAIHLGQTKAVIGLGKQEVKMKTSIIDKVVEQLEALPYGLQRQVLQFTRALALSVPRGVPGRQLLRFAGAIPLADLQIMRQAIEQGCEQVDVNESVATHQAGAASVD